MAVTDTNLIKVKTLSKAFARQIVLLTFDSSREHPSREKTVEFLTEMRKNPGWKGIIGWVWRSAFGDELPHNEAGNKDFCVAKKLLLVDALKLPPQSKFRAERLYWMPCNDLGETYNSPQLFI